MALPRCSCDPARCRARGHSVLYTGDTRPCQNLERLFARARSLVPTSPSVRSVLVHEATFEDSRRDDAERKRHSTVGEAVQGAASMGADVLLLTHFSQRYPHHHEQRPRLEASGAVVVVGHDLLRLEFGVPKEGLL